MGKDRKKKGKKRIIDKVLMGAVIGGAIGSVVGASIAPKKGKETRKEIVGVIGKVKRFLTKEKKEQPLEEEPKKIPHEHA